MIVKQRVSVDARPDDVWEALGSPALVATCFPGALLTADHGDGRCDGTVTVQLGPTRLVLEGSAAFARDEAQRTIFVQARGRQRRGGNHANVEAEIRLLGDPDRAELDVEVNVVFVGGLAALVEATGHAMAEQLAAEFTACLAARVGSTSPPARGATTVSISPGMSPATVRVFPLLRRSVARWLRSRWRRLTTRSSRGQHADS